MPLFTWKEIYSVGNDKIDEQHKRLFEIANRFYKAHEENHDSQVLESIFSELLDYTQLHFKDEEELLQKVGYPDYDKHKANHEKLIAVVMNLKKNFEAGEDGIEERIMDFLKMWLNGHILGMDRQYQAHLNDESEVDRYLLAGQPESQRPKKTL